MFDRNSIKYRAKEMFVKRYFTYMGRHFLIVLLSLVSLALGLVIFPPVLEVGCKKIYLNIYRGKESSMKDVFWGFEHFGHIWYVMMLRSLIVLAGLVCLIVPGIMLAMKYYMVPYLLADNPDISAKEALGLSADITKGHIGELVMVYVSFIGWYIICIVSFTLQYFFFFGPYYKLTKTGYYCIMKRYFDSGDE